MKTRPNAGITEYPKVPQRENLLVQSISREDIGWIAGIIDGEGTISLVKQSLYNGHKYVRNDTEYGDYRYMNLQPIVSVTSTSFELLRRLTELYSAMGLKYHYMLNTHVNPKWNDSVCVRVCALNSVCKLLSNTKELLTEKKPRADIVYEYCLWKKLVRVNISERRSVADFRNKSGQQKPGSLLSDKELLEQSDLWERFQLLPAKSPTCQLSETSRRGSQPIELKCSAKRDQGIVHAL